MKEKTFEVYLYLICVILLIVGGLNWGLIGTFNLNIVKLLNEYTFDSPIFENAVYITVGIAAIYLSTKRNFYLPFLGNTILPPSLLKDIDNKNANISITVDAPNADMVIYWAAEPLAENEVDGSKFAYDAYDKYTNSGIAEVISGKAVLKVTCPQTYWVKKWGIKKTLPKHVHYRLVYSTGWVSEVKTSKLLC
jgi:uncharacterized membrane protein YuzA (DUF378 family)